MQCVVSKADLVRGTSQASHALHDDERDLVLTHYLFEAIASGDGSGPRLRISSTNRASSVLAEVSLRRIIEPGRCTLPGIAISQLSSKVPDADLHIHASADGKVVLKGGPKEDIKFVMQSLDTEDFGESFSDFSKSERLREGEEKYLTAHFLAHIQRARRFVGEDDSRPAQMVMTLREGNFLAGDGKVFHCAKTSLSDLKIVFSVPGPVTLGLVRYLKDISSEKIDFRYSDNYFYVVPASDPDKGYFGFIRQDVDWPAVEGDLLPRLEKEDSPEFSVDRPSFLNALERLAIVISAGQVGVALRIQRGLRQSTLTLATRDSRGNESTEFLPCQWSGGEQGEFFFNIFQVIKLLRLSVDPICRLRVLDEVPFGVMTEDLPESEKLVMSTTRIPQLVEEEKPLDDGVNAEGEAVTKGKVTAKTSSRKKKVEDVDDDAVEEAIDSLEDSM